MYIFTCSLACVHTLLVAETPAEDPSFLTQHEGQGPVHCFISVLSQPFLLSSSYQSWLFCSSFASKTPLQISCAASHISGASSLKWYIPYCRALLKNHKPKRNGLLGAEDSLEKLVVEQGPQCFLFSSNAEIFCKKHTNLFTPLGSLSKYCDNKSRVCLAAGCSLLGLMPRVRQKECLSLASKSDALSH